MTTNSASYDGYAEAPEPRTVEELAQQQGITTPKTVEDLADDAIFETDEELDEFLTFVREQRDSSLA
ncbi:MAG TPA: hypothetical protein VHX38_35665 [Pseudonocardiaceae bacterium]|jgi:hypothetical protein|nr:hypothetical protein [Pseudonocardiaceae bacterium]